MKNPLTRCAWAMVVVAGAICSSAVLAESPAGLPRAAADQVGMRVDALAKIPAQMKQFVAAGQISGAVTLVAKDGKIVALDAVGLRDVESQAPMQEDTLFAIASMTKPITATALMMLVDEGKIALDDPVAKFIPEFKDAHFQDGAKPNRDITVFDCITHTSGVVGDQANVGTLAETAKMLAARPLGFQSGERWQYSPGISICGRVIEVASGMPYEKFLHDRIFEPLGMNDTSFLPEEAKRSRVVSLYRPGKQKGTLEKATHWINDLGDDRTPNPSGGLFSTAADLARFYQAILSGGQLNEKRILSEQAVRQMTSVQTGELKTGFTPGNGWGLGWCVVREPQGVSRSLSPGSFGHGGAFGTQGWIDPERKMVFVLMIQRTAFGNSDASDLRGALQDMAVDALAP
ncbi:MAG: beta-lactamase family protein [Planctomycetales bacterium]|nr:beta-lactamase family protein [Planctomycetales bacterium]